jgi:hypothetical protein
MCRRFSCVMMDRHCVFHHSARSHVLRPQLYQDISQIVDVRDLFGPMKLESIVSVKRLFAIRSLRNIGNILVHNNITKHNRLERVIITKLTNKMHYID